MINCTGIDTDLGAIRFQNELERTVGYALGTSDLLGQMAASDYVEKLPVLYEEFAEAARNAPAGSAHLFAYESAEALMRNTPAFWEKYVQPKVDGAFRRLYAFLNDPYPDGPNDYLQRIEANMARLRQLAKRFRRRPSAGGAPPARPSNSKSTIISVASASSSRFRFGVGQRVRHGKARLDLEQRVGGHRGADDLGMQLLDADAAPGEATGQIAHDARTIVPGELEPDDPVRSLPRARIAHGDGHVEPGRAEPPERAGERLGVLVRHLEMNDARELARQARHAAAGPVGAEALGDIGQLIDDARVIGTDHGQDERLRHGFSPPGTSRS